MAFTLADRVRETTTSVGTGAITLAGAVTGFRSFSAGIGNANSTYYAIVLVSAGEWEVGIGTYTAATNSLSRDTVLASTNSNNAVSFSAGTKDVFCTQPAGKAVFTHGGSVKVLDGSTIPNTLLANDSITVNGTTIALGDVGTINLDALTFGAGLTAGSYNGSAPVTLNVDNTQVFFYADGPLAIADGGTGATNAADARAALGVPSSTGQTAEPLTFGTGLVAGSFDGLTPETVELEPGIDTRGLQAIYIAAGSMTPSTTDGCAALATVEISAGQPDITTLDFDATTQEYAQFSFVMPEKWDGGTVTAKFEWSHAATTTNFGVVWDLQGVAVTDDGAIGVAFGTAQVIADTGGTTNDLYISGSTPAITISGSPAGGKMVFFRLSRVTGNGSDTMAIDARLHGLTLYVTTDAGTDA